MYKLFKNTKLKFIITISILTILYIFISAHAYASTMSKNISDNVFRLHVIANSDTDFDQDLKLKVRDNLLYYMKSICNKCQSKQEAQKIIIDNKEAFKKIALDTIYSNGYNYNIKINIGNFDFPTKNYGDISLPSGKYDALRVEIGNAQGKNWWCVMFPPLCFVDITSGIVDDSSKELLQNNLSTDEFNLISDNNTDIKLKFKIVELFNKYNN